MELYLLKILRELNTLRKYAKREDHYRVIKTSAVIEKYITINDVNEYLEKYNFKIIYKYTSNNSNITDLYEWYVCEKSIDIAINSTV